MLSYSFYRKLSDGSSILKKKTQRYASLTKNKYAHCESKNTYVLMLQSKNSNGETF